MSDARIPLAQISRRQFCSGACSAAPLAALGTMLTGCAGESSPTGPSSMVTTLGVSAGQFTGNAVRVDVNGTALTTVGGAVLVESTAGVFLLARTSDSAFSAVDAICSHESCTITGADGSVYVCPCHGSRYSRSGQVLNGPAQASLRQFGTVFSNGVVTIAL